MKLTIEDIKHIATLARLELSPSEVVTYASELSVVFDYFALLDEVDVATIPETTQVTGLMNVVRMDASEELPKEKRDDLLRCFPKRNGELLTVKAVFADTEE